MASCEDRPALTAQRNRQEIIRAKLSRGEMLLTRGDGPMVGHGLSARAVANGGVDLPPIGKPAIQPMPVPLVNRFNATRMTDGPSAGPTLIDTTLVHRATTLPGVNRQLFTLDPGTKPSGGKFPPRKFYEFDARRLAIKLHPSNEATTVWGFDGQLPGPNFLVNYHDPVLMRFKNKLPPVNRGTLASARWRHVRATVIPRPGAMPTRSLSSTRSTIRTQ
jgi:hypothetical protein